MSRFILVKGTLVSAVCSLAFTWLQGKADAALVENECAALVGKVDGGYVLKDNAERAKYLLCLKSSPDSYFLAPGLKAIGPPRHDPLDILHGDGTIKG